LKISYGMTTENVLPAQELPRESTRNRGGMSRQNRDLSQYALRLMENAQLSQHRAPVVIDFFPGRAVIGVERVHTAKRELNSTPRRRKATPSAEVRTANYDFNENSVVCDMSALYLDC
jgi:hypothetical protein